MQSGRNLSCSLNWLATAAKPSPGTGWFAGLGPGGVGVPPLGEIAARVDDQLVEAGHPPATGRVGRAVDRRQPGGGYGGHLRPDDLEVLSRVTAPARLAEVTRLRSAALHWLITTDADLQAAIRAQREMLEAGQTGGLLARQSCGCGSPSPRGAGAAQRSCFERIGKLTGQDMQWEVPGDVSDRFPLEVARQDGCDRAP